MGHARFVAFSLGREAGGVTFWAPVDGFAAGAVPVFVFRQRA